MFFMQPAMLKRGIYALLLVLVVTVPLIFWQASLFPFQIPKLLVFEGAVELMAGLWVALLFLGGARLPRARLLLIALGAFFISLFISAFAGVDFLRSMWSSADRMLGLVALFHFGTLFLIAASVLDAGQWKRVWQASYATAAAAAVLALLERGPLMDFLLRQNPGRPGGTFGNPAFLGIYLLFHLFIGGWLWREYGKRGARAWTGLGLLLILSGIMFSQTIAIMLGLAIGVLFLVLWYAFTGSTRVRRTSVAVLACLVVLGGTLFLTRHAPLWDKVPGVSRITDLSLAQVGVGDRLIAWKIAVEGWRERPLLGYGPENFYVPFEKHYDPHLLRTGNSTVFDKPHNLYLEYLATGGVVGLVAYLALLAAAGVTLVRARWQGDFRGDWRPFFGAALIAYAVQNAFLFDVLASYLFFFLILAFAAARNGNEGESRSRRSAAWRTWAGVGSILTGVVIVFLLPAPIAVQGHSYYIALDSFLHNDPNTSQVHWQKALTSRSPYRDHIAKDYAATLTQGIAQGVLFPDLPARKAEAFAALQEGERRHPMDHTFLLALADFHNGIYLWQSDPAELEAARNEEMKALALSPNRQEVYFMLARTQLLQQDMPGALATLKRAVELNPEAGESHFFYGLMAYEIGDASLGEREIARALALGREPRTSDEAVRLGEAVGDKQGNYAAAAGYFLKARELAANPELFPNITLKLAIAHYQAGNLEGARAEFGNLKAQGVDVTRLVIWPALRPILDRLGISY